MAASKAYYKFDDCWRDIVPEPYKNDVERMNRFEWLVKLMSTFRTFRHACQLDSNNVDGGDEEIAEHSARRITLMRYVFDV